MSGKPTKQGVDSFRFELGRLSIASDRVAVLRQEIEVRQVELKNQEAEFDRSQREVLKLAEGMDVQSTGNFGCEGRLTWMLVELYRQMERAAKAADNFFDIEDE